MSLRERNEDRTKQIKSKRQEERERERELTLLNEVVLFKGVIFTLVSGCAQRVSPAE